MAAVKEKALCAKVPRVSHERIPAGACSAHAAGWRGTSPRKASAKEISVIMSPRQNGTERWEKRNTERRQNTVELHQGLRSERDKDLRPAPAHFQAGSGDPWEQHLSQGGSRLLPVPGSPCCVPRNKPSSCWQHLWVSLVHGNIRLGDVLS